MALPVVLAIVSLFISVYAKTDLTFENHVAVLTKDNFDKILDEYPFVLVEFYAPWCGHCKALKPEYEKAAESLKESNQDVLIAKVDATVETELASLHDVSGYPTLKFRKNGTWIPYNGGRTSSEIVNWVVKKTGPAVAALQTADELESFLKSHDVVVVGFIKPSASGVRQVLEQTADEMDDVSFVVVESPDIFDKYGVQKESQIIVFKSFDENRVPFEKEIEKSSLKDFIHVESIPIVAEYSQEMAGKVFNSPVKKHLLAFVPKSGSFQEIKSKLEKAAKKFKHAVHFILVDTDFEDHVRILEFFGMTKDEVPAYRLIDLDEDMTKFKPDSSDFDENVLENFVNGVLSGSVKPFLMSQEIPTTNDGSVRVLVGKNYNEVTQDQSKAVFVKHYAPWCTHCKNLAPVWEKLGDAFKDRDDIIIAKMDATVNEAEGLKIQSFPTLKYYPKGSSESIDYTGERTFDELMKFVESEGKMGTQDKPEMPEENKDEL